MPRIVTGRIFGFLYIGFHLNDYGEITNPKFGFTAEQAAYRVVKAL